MKKATKVHNVVDLEHTSRADHSEFSMHSPG